MKIISLINRFNNFEGDSSKFSLTPTVGFVLFLLLCDLEGDFNCGLVSNGGGG